MLEYLDCIDAVETGRRGSQILHVPYQVLFARRSRWWGILTHPAIGIVPWEPMAKCMPLSLVVHVLDAFKYCTDAESQQLELD